MDESFPTPVSQAISWVEVSVVSDSCISLFNVLGCKIVSSRRALSFYLVIHTEYKFVRISFVILQSNEIPFVQFWVRTCLYIYRSITIR